MDEDCVFCRSSGLYSRGHSKINCFRLQKLQPCYFCGASGADNHTASHCPRRPRIILPMKTSPYYSHWILKHPHWILQSLLLTQDLRPVSPSSLSTKLSTFSSDHRPYIVLPKSVIFPPSSSSLNLPMSPTPQSPIISNDECLLRDSMNNNPYHYHDISDDSGLASIDQLRFDSESSLSNDDGKISRPSLQSFTTNICFDSPSGVNANYEQNNFTTSNDSTDFQADSESPTINGDGRSRLNSFSSSKTTEPYLVRFRPRNVST